MRYFILLGIIVLLIFRPLISERTFPEYGFYFDILLILIFTTVFLRNDPFLLVRLPLFIPISAYILLVLLTAPFSINIHASLGVVRSSIFSVFAFYIGSQSSKKEAKVFLFAMAAVAAAVCLYGSYQLLFLSLGRRVFATFFSPDMLAGYLLLILPVASAFLFAPSAGRVVRISAVSLGGLLFLTLLLTRSLGGVLTVIPVISIFFALLVREETSIEQKRKLLFFSIVALAIVVMALAAVVITRKAVLLDLSDPANPIRQRLGYWAGALGAIRRFPFTGVGGGNFGIIYPAGKLAGAGETIFAHNAFLQLWAEFGVFGPLVLLWLIVSFLKQGMSRSLDPESHVLRVCLTVAAAAFLIHNLIDYDFFIPQVSFQWWFILGLLCSIRGWEESAKSRAAASPPRARRLIKIFFLLLAVYLASSSCRDFFVYSHHKKAGAFIRVNKLDDAVEEIKHAIRLDPGDDFSHFFLAGVYERKLRTGPFNEELFEGVVREYKMAIAISPYYPFHYGDLGGFYLDFGRADEAVAFLKRASELYPQHQAFQDLLKSAKERAGRKKIPTFP